MTVREHCWHSDGICLASYPAQYPETCCFCGAKRTRTYKLIPSQGHGPFILNWQASGSTSFHQGPFQQEEVFYGGEESCIEREINDDQKP